MAITRRLFLGVIPALSLFGLVPPGAKPVPGIMINVFSIAGFQYYQGPKVLGALEKGENLTLVAEPGNPHDEYAVEIYRERTKLGYVPRSDNRHISRMLMERVRLTCEVAGIRPDSPSWNAVRVKVFLPGQGGA